MINNISNSLSDTQSLVTPKNIRTLYWKFPKAEAKSGNLNQVTLEKLGKNIARIFRSYQKFFPQFSGREYEDIAQEFCENFFLADFNDSISVNLANLSLSDNADKRITLSIRIPAHPIFKEYLGLNITVAVIGYCPTATPNPIFIPERVVFTHGQVEAANYEAQQETTFQQLQENHYPPRSALNLLNPEFTKTLPKYGVKTKERLAGWLDFLTFKNNLIKHKTQGLRYLRWAFKEETGQVHFVVIAENEQILRKARAAFSRQNLHAFKMETSNDRFRFVLPRKDTSRVESAFSQLGQLANNGIKVIQANNPDKAKVNAYEQLRRELKEEAGEDNHFDFGKAVFADVFVDLSEEFSNKIAQFEDNVDSDGNADKQSREAKISNIFSKLPESGFLSISLVGDLALIERHRRAVQNLQQNEACYSPYLSSYLFDIENANLPSEIPDNIEWDNKNLNDRQKSAVQKMLAAPDICLIQGPPGTGKTTVIAEACLQFAKRGETVLLVSQAHDALDNALSRLQNHPELRAIRLARSANRITEEGKQFTGESVLGKQYAALKNHIHHEYLQPLVDLKAQIEKINEWEEQADFIAHDLAQLRNKYQQNRHQLNSAEQALAQARADFESKTAAFKQHCQEVSEIQQIITFLSGENKQGSLSQLSVGLPESVYPLAEALSRLMNAKIELRFSYQHFLVDKENQTAILGNCFEYWQKVSAAMPKMQMDLVRLQEGHTSSADTQTQLQIEALSGEIEELAARLEKEDDDNLFLQWKQKRRERTQLQENTSQKGGLHAETYRLFNDADRFLQANDNEGLKALLVQRLSLLESLKIEIDQQTAQAISALAHHMQGYDLREPDNEALQAQQTEVNRLSGVISELVAQEKRKQEQAADILRQGGFDPDDDIVQIVETQRAHLLELQEELADLQEKNQAFMPLFESWQEILKEPEKRAAADWNELEKPFVESCNLVAITCNENERTLTDNDFDGFDVVIIDEVSKATPLEMLLPLMRGKKAILVGDHRQLPPVFNEADGLTFEDEVEQNEALEDKQVSDTDLTQENLRKYEKMVTASLFKELFEQAPEALRERLTIQFRMHPEIMRMINFFYENQLECGNPNAERSHGIEFKGLLSKKDHLLWVDTTNDENGRRFKIDDGAGNVNRLEARMIARTLVDMNRQLEAQGYGKANKMKVGVVSFYQPQCRIIRDEIRKLNKGKLSFSALDVEINTVIRYQGKEKPIILLSLVKNNGGEMNQKFRAGRANIARFEFINVAMSRAQNLLLVFGARNMLENREVKLPRMDKQGFDKKMVYKQMFKYLEYQAQTGGICVTKEFTKVLPHTQVNPKARGNK